MADLSIGQLERLLSIPATTLRFWEKTVPFLAPPRSRSGRRVYSLTEAALIARLKHLALDKKLGLHRAQQLLEFELLYEDQEARACATALRTEVMLLLLRSDFWHQAHAELVSSARTSEERLSYGTDD